MVTFFQKVEHYDMGRRGRILEMKCPRTEPEALPDARG